MSRLQMTPQTLLQPVGDEAVLLNVATGQYYELNSVGLRMVQLLQQHDQAATVAQLLLEFDVAPETLTADVDELIADLKQHGLAIEAV